MQGKQRNKTIEIYFILYLAALVFLIPGKEGEVNDELSFNKSNPRIFQLPFGLKPEKNTLAATVKLDSTGLRITSFDSVNTIFYTGNVRDVKFDVSIEDRSTRQVLAIDENTAGSNLFFRYNVDQSNQMLRFVWNPPFYDRQNKTYIVRVSAQCISNEASSQGQIVEDVVQFSLVINYITDFDSNLLFANESGALINNQIQDSAINSLVPVYTPPANLFMTPREEIIRALAYSTWENELSIFGLDPKFDLRKQPDIKLIREPDNRIGGSARIVGFTPSSIILKGETPGYGTLKVAVSMIRHSDGKEAIREFKVVPQMMEDPKFEQIMYPAVKYIFDPRLPIISGQKASSYLKSSDGKIVATSSNGGKFEFTPALSDTGKIFIFERYLDNNLIGQKYSVKVQMYPIPEIARISDMGNRTIRIFTNCYGYHQGAENYITKIEILQGNVKIREVIGAQRNEEDKMVFRQVFEITSNSGESQLTFRIQAVALNGQKSEISVYPLR
ncbi:hypothetical protein MASR1M45_24530 [Candidatus Kapaibacterium sp.]